MPILTGEKAKLLTKAGNLKKQIKLMEKELGEVRKELNLKEVGEYTTTKENPIVLTISETKAYTEIDSLLLFRYMKEQKQLKHFWKCIKVQLTTLKKYVPESRYDTWRKPLDPILKWTFK